MILPWALLLLFAAAPTVQDLQRAFEKHPDNPVIVHDLTLALVQAGELQRARAVLQDLVRKRDRAEWHNLMGLVEERAKNLDEAGRQYQTAAQMDPSEQNVFDLGNCLLQYDASDNAV